MARNAGARRVAGLTQFPIMEIMSAMADNMFTSSVFYRDPRAALAWLERAFGFEITLAIDPPPDQPTMGHYEMSCAGAGRIMIGSEWAEWTRSPAGLGGANTQSVHVQLPGGLDTHCERARSAGAQIVAEPADQFYGDRTYRAIDPEGHCWTFATHVRDVTKAEAVLGQPIMASGWE